MDNNIKKLYPERKIISLYYDNINNQMFKDKLKVFCQERKLGSDFTPMILKKIFFGDENILIKGRFKKTINYQRKLW